MGLLTVLFFGLGMAFTRAVQDYFQYEAQIAEYNAWVIETRANEQ